MSNYLTIITLSFTPGPTDPDTWHDRDANPLNATTTVGSQYFCLRTVTYDCDFLFPFFFFFFRLYYILYDININMYIYIPFLYTTAVALSSSRHFCMGEKSWDLSGPRTHAGPRIDGNKRSVENNAPLQGKVFIFWPFAFLISSMLHFVFHILFTYDPIFSIKLIIVTDTVKFLFESTS